MRGSLLTFTQNTQHGFSGRITVLGLSLAFPIELPQVLDREDCAHWRRSGEFSQQWWPFCNFPYLPEVHLRWPRKTCGFSKRSRSSSMNNAISLAQKYNLLWSKVLTLATRRPCPAWVAAVQKGDLRKFRACDLSVYNILQVSSCESQSLQLSRFGTCDFSVYSTAGFEPTPSLMFLASCSAS